VSDPHQLERFLHAQEGSYAAALAELRRGRKQSHWMWFVFPQIAGLGLSDMSVRYAIASLAEADAYLRHPILGPRLLACADAVLAVTKRSALEIVGPADVLKLRSCATLFARVSPEGSVFHQILDRYFDGEPDPKTIAILQLQDRSTAG
jgi:uncharacterized protein (DUF1810 family)